MMTSKASIAEAEARTLHKGSDVGKTEVDPGCLDQAGPPPKVVMKVKTGEGVRLVRQLDGCDCAATIHSTQKNGVTLATRGPAPRPYFAVGTTVTLYLRDGLVVYARVWDNRDGLLVLRKLIMRG
jgi:hypothetical protein